MKGKISRKPKTVPILLLFFAALGALHLQGLAMAAGSAGTGDPADPGLAVSSSRTSIGDFLLDDGTLDIGNGFQGALDARGYRMVSGAGEAPRFEPAAAVGRWSGAFDVTGVAGGASQISSVVMDGNGNLYVGGDFQVAGKVFAKNIARWDGQNWSALGSGVNNSILSLAVDSSGNLYAGGNFTKAGEVNASRIARWDGTNWSRLAGDVNGPVGALACGESGDVMSRV